MEGNPKAIGEGRPLILFATVAVGGGHVATARAMAEAVERLHPGRFGTRVSDYMEDLGVDGLDAFHKGFWRTALRYPFIARNGQRLIDSFPRTTVAGQRRIVRPFVAPAAAALKKEPPLLVVSNHGMLTSGFAEAKRLHGLCVPVLTYATEPFAISAYWADPRADHIAVPAAEVKDDLVRMGVPAEKVSVVGYPVRRAFLAAPSKAEARARLGLEERFTALISLGGEGLGGGPREAARALLASKVAPQVVVICGRNKKLATGLRALKEPGLRVEGFVEDMASYVAASDVVVGKAGPASVHEALAVGRPVLATGYAGLNELGVIRFLEKEGLGRHVRNPADLTAAVGRYASDQALLDAVAERAAKLELPAQTERLARFVVDYALENARTPPR